MKIFVYITMQNRKMFEHKFSAEFNSSEIPCFDNATSQLGNCVYMLSIDSFV